MPRHVWTMCCENAVVDARTNNVSLINAIEQISVPAAAPVIAMRLVIVSLWARDSGGHVPVKCRFLWQGPGERDSSLLGEFSAEIEPEKRRSRLFIHADRLDLWGPGDYSLVTELQDPDGAWRVVSRYPVEVVQPAG